TPIPTITFFLPPGPGQTSSLVRTQEDLAPTNVPMVWRPSDWSLVLAQSYVRHLCRQYGAARGELVRHSRPAVLPALMLMAPVPANFFEEQVNSFGDGHPVDWRPAEIKQ